MGILASQRKFIIDKDQIKRSNLRMYNCTSTHAMRNNCFSRSFLLALKWMRGVGVGLIITFLIIYHLFKKILVVRHM